ncbi:hypothetical protein WA538_003237, partial [Blastocystis sp. DL]
MDSTTKENVVLLISCILQNVVKQQDTGLASSPITPFTAMTIPRISLDSYYERILKYSNCSVECLVHSLIYIDRLIQGGEVSVNSLSIHRIILTSVTLAIKYFDDVFYLNSFYSQIGGISVDELNSLELEFLKDINFSLFVSWEDYQKYHNELCMHARSDLCPCCSRLQVPLLVEEENPDHCVLSYQEMKSSIPSPCVVAHDSCTR